MKKAALLLALCAVVSSCNMNVGTSDKSDSNSGATGATGATGAAKAAEKTSY